MRSVNMERKPRAARATRAAPTRAKRELPAVQPGSGRKVAKPSIFARFLPRRPMVVLICVVTVLVLLGALFASGVIGRTVRGINNGINGWPIHAKHNHMGRFYKKGCLDWLGLC